MKIFGYQITRHEDKVNQEVVAPPENTDGALEITSNFTNFYNTSVAYDNSPIQDEVKLITQYRELAMQPEIKRAVDDIINETFAYDENDYPISINLDKVESISEKVKEKIQDEFEYVLNLLNIRQDAYEIFRRWYVDGRIFYEMVIDSNKPNEGLKELRYIDPRKIRKVREPVRDKTVKMIYSVEVNKKYRYYYIYNPTGISSQNSTQGIKIAPDSIAHANSGILDKSNRVILSNLQDAIKPFNQYKMMKDASIIYYHTRAPERRIFNVEVGNLPKVRAEQYLKEVMAKYRRKPTFDPVTGEIIDAKREMTMNEDYWFARRDGKGTTIDTIAGGANLSDIMDVVDFYKDELYEALNVPVSRYKENTSVGNYGRTSEITRDELKFSKFVSRLRKRFSVLFDEILGTHLALKNIISIDDWTEIKNEIYYDFLEDNFWSELKWSEILQNRMETMASAADYIGRYFSEEWAAKNIFKMTDEEFEEQKKQIKAEREEMMDDETHPDSPANPMNMPPPPEPAPKPMKHSLNINVTKTGKDS